MKDKTNILKNNGSFNAKHFLVNEPSFQSGAFFDPHDLIQVKYEMLRLAEKDGVSVTEAAGRFGFSRESFYKNKAAFGKEGLRGLVPKKTGPKGSTKLVGEGEAFIEQYIRDNPDARPKEINDSLRKKIGIAVHDRTIERYLSKKRMGSR